MLAEFIEDLNHGLILDGLNIGERYLIGDANIVISADWRGGKYNFIFAPLPLRIDPRDISTEFNILYAGHDGNEIGVFIDEIKIMKGSEQIAVPSIVWLQRAQSIFDTIGNFLALTPQGKFESVEILPTREIRIISRTVRRIGARANHLIEGASQIINGVSGNQARFAGKWLCKPCFMDTVPRLPIILEYVGRGIRVDKSVISEFEISDMMFGPLNFYLWAIKRIVSHGR